MGGGSLTNNSQMLLVHGVGRTVTIAQIGNIVVKAEERGTDSRSRRGRCGDRSRDPSRSGDGRRPGRSRCCGLGFMLMGENSHEVTYRTQGESRTRSGHVAAGCGADERVRSHRAGRPCHSHGSKESVRRRSAGDRRPVRVARQSASWPDRGCGDSACRCCLRSRAC